MRSVASSNYLFFGASLLVIMTAVEALSGESPSKYSGLLVFGTILALTLMVASYMLLSHLIGDEIGENSSSIFVTINTLDSSYLMVPPALSIILLLLASSLGNKARFPVALTVCGIVLGMNVLYARLGRKRRINEAKDASNDLPVPMTDAAQSSLAEFEGFSGKGNAEPKSELAVTRKYDYIDVGFFVVGLMIIAIGVASALWLLTRG